MQDAYVFDMGGVIKESFDLEKFYSKIDSKKAFNDFKKYWDENILIAEIGNISSEEFLHRILEYSLSSKDIAESKKIYGECTGNLYNDAKNVLYSIKEKNKKLYLLSNLKEIDFEYFEKKIDINIFEDVFLSYKLGCMKNDIKIFEIVIDKLNIKVLKKAIESYHRRVDSIEDKARGLEDKQKSEVGLTNEEEQLLLKLHMELNSIDSKANPVSAELLQTSSLKNLAELVKNSRTLLDSIK